MVFFVLIRLFYLKNAPWAGLLGQAGTQGFNPPPCAGVAGQLDTMSLDRSLLAQLFMCIAQCDPWLIVGHNPPGGPCLPGQAPQPTWVGFPSPRGPPKNGLVLRCCVVLRCPTHRSMFGTPFDFDPHLHSKPSTGDERNPERNAFLGSGRRGF